MIVFYKRCYVDGMVTDVLCSWTIWAITNQIWQAWSASKAAKVHSLLLADDLYFRFQYTTCVNIYYLSGSNNIRLMLQLGQVIPDGIQQYYLIWCTGDWRPYPNCLWIRLVDMQIACCNLRRYSIATSLHSLWRLAPVPELFINWESATPLESDPTTIVYCDLSSPLVCSRYLRISFSFWNGIWSFRF